MGSRLRFGLVLITVTATLALQVGAQSPAPARRFTRSRVTGRVVPAVPLGFARPMTVVLKMAGDPVAVVKSRIPGKRIADGDRRAIEQDLRAR
jgi:hypothetical protein